MDRSVDTQRIYEIFRSIFRFSPLSPQLLASQKRIVKVRIEIRLCNEKFVFCFRDFHVISRMGESSKISGHVARFPTQLIIVHRQILCLFAPFARRFMISPVLFITNAACLPVFIGVILSDDLLDYDSKLSARDKPRTFSVNFSIFHFIYKFLLTSFTSSSFHYA
jgi:hypothetical protein